MTSKPFHSAAVLSIFVSGFFSAPSNGFAAPPDRTGPNTVARCNHQKTILKGIHEAELNQALAAKTHDFNTEAKRLVKEVQKITDSFTDTSTEVGKSVALFKQILEESREEIRLNNTKYLVQLTRHDDVPKVLRQLARQTFLKMAEELKGPCERFTRRHGLKWNSFRGYEDTKVTAEAYALIDDRYIKNYNASARLSCLSPQGNLAENFEVRVAFTGNPLLNSAPELSVAVDWLTKISPFEEISSFVSKKRSRLEWNGSTKKLTATIPYDVVDRLVVNSKEVMIGGGRYFQELKAELLNYDGKRNFEIIDLTLLNSDGFIQHVLDFELFSGEIPECLNLVDSMASPSVMAL